MFVYELSGCWFESCCSYVNTRYCAYSKQGKVIQALKLRQFQREDLLNTRSNMTKNSSTKVQSSSLIIHFYPRFNSCRKISYPISGSLLRCRRESKCRFYASSNPLRGFHGLRRIRHAIAPRKDVDLL